ncbi:hypothetical protein KM043_001106 [Ampulex compressa]|nr:hypothetical protein KM043_001106 [Ampulex compressa]
MYPVEVLSDGILEDFLLETKMELGEGLQAHQRRSHENPWVLEELLKTPRYPRIPNYQPMMKNTTLEPSKPRRASIEQDNLCSREFLLTQKVLQET